MLWQSGSIDFDGKVSLVQGELLEPAVEKWNYHWMNLSLKQVFFGVSDSVYSSMYLLLMSCLDLFFLSTSFSSSFLIIGVAILFSIDFNILIFYSTY